MRGPFIAFQLPNPSHDDPKLKAKLADLGDHPMPMTPSEFGKLIALETEKWAKVVRKANLKPS